VNPQVLLLLFDLRSKLNNFDCILNTAAVPAALRLPQAPLHVVLAGEGY